MPETLYSLALNKAVKLLYLKFYSEREMREKLKRHDYDDETIRNVLDYLTKEGYLNDFKLCQSLFNKLSRSGNYGQRLVRAKLMARSLPEAMISENMKEYNPEDEAEQALKLAKKRYKYGGKLNNPEIEKIARYLTNKGFSSFSVKKVICALQNEENPDDE